MMQRRVQHRLYIEGELGPTGFRSALQREATRQGAVGWVRDVEGGAEAVIQGREGTVLALTRWCERGPRSAAVRAVRARPEPIEAFGGFDVRR
jgi:acylphosphatase